MFGTMRHYFDAYDFWCNLDLDLGNYILISSFSFKIKSLEIRCQLHNSLHYNKIGKIYLNLLLMLNLHVVRMILFRPSWYSGFCIEMFFAVTKGDQVSSIFIVIIKCVSALSIFRSLGRDVPKLTSPFMWSLKLFFV